MRVRRLATLFWALCTVAALALIYYFTEIALKTPSRASPHDDMKDNKWLHFEDKLKHLESEVSEYHAVVGELKSVVQDLLPKKDSDKNVDQDIVNRFKASKVSKILDLLDTDGDDMKCSLKMDRIPNTQIQMLSVYDNLTFDNPDGGPWKQGWRVTYDEHQWNPHHKLKVFVVPHSHNDPGWLKTFEEYYASQTRSIFNNIITKLPEDSRRKFIWAEISFLSLWWNEVSEEQRAVFKKLIQSKQLEIVTGGWVMNDEANSHWISVVQQLTTGHQWLKENLNVVPKSGWAIDPFGHSATQPYLVKLTGINGSLIQRIHYNVKKKFAKDKQLEFLWRQTWDDTGVTDLWTHMMPFYSYDVPHTCGPDPKVCCQFDFKRLPGYGLSCPWKVPPQQINERNVKAKSELILDQWRKKSQLYKTRVVLIPLGDDFRWDHSTEWDAQFNNYEKILSYLNSNENLNVEAHFGTLSDYFNAVKAEKSSEEFPVLSGDFFTYADRDDHYWSGYYTSRPFYKRMDRVLMSYLRAAELILTLARSRTDIPTVAIGIDGKLTNLLETARQSLALFQHHDGVTGTSKDPVVIDYGNKLLNAIANCHRIIQQSAYHLMVKPDFYYPVEDHFYFEIDDIRRQHNTLPEKITITIGLEAPSRKIVIFNSLSFTRNEVISFYVSTEYVKILDENENSIDCQISPVISSETVVSEHKFLVSFVATVPAFGLSSYIVTAVERTTLTSSTVFANLRFLNFDGDPFNSGIFKAELLTRNLGGDFTLKTTIGETIIAAFSQNGLLKGIKMPNMKMVPIHLDFRKYGTRETGDKSGAYLFLPGAQESVITASMVPPLITVVEGPIVSKMTVQYPFVQHTVSIYSTSNYFVEVNNIVDVTNSQNTELAMRLSTEIKNGDVFYTDLNGFQMIRRKYFRKIPLQANFYPLPTAAYVEDNDMRFTLLSSTSLGVAALAPGQIEVMQDRRLNQDDNRGLAQFVLDNHPTHHAFRILLEHRRTDNCDGIAQGHPAGALSLAAHVSSLSLTNPLISLFYNSDGHPERTDADWSHGENLIGAFTPTSIEPGVDVHVASYRDNVLATLPDGVNVRGQGLVVHRQFLDMCFDNVKQVNELKINDGQVKLSELFVSLADYNVRNSSLSYLHLGNTVNPTTPQNICPMEIYTYFIHN